MISRHDKSTLDNGLTQLTRIFLGPPFVLPRSCPCSCCCALALAASSVRSSPFPCFVLARLLVLVLLVLFGWSALRLLREVVQLQRPGI